VVCEPRPYVLLDKRFGLMSLDFQAARDRVHERHPFFRSSVFERRMLFERLQQPAESTPKRQPLRVVELSGAAVANAR
jgi:hypothetical protein